MLLQGAAMLALLLVILVNVNGAAVQEFSRRELGSFTLVPQAERAALFAFYTGLGGSKWTWRDTSANGPAWDVASLKADGSGSVDVCSWQGIECDCSTHKHPFQGANEQEFYYDDVAPVPASECHVTKIQLINMGLKGSLPSSLQSLTKLKVLQLGNNALTGNLNNLAGLVSLTKIHIQASKIQGQLPSFLYSFVSLKSLWLYDNSLTGSIPTSFGNLFQLQSLILHSNFLTGSLPTTLSQCTLLKTLDLSHNLLSGQLDSSYASLSKMKVFRINTNKGIGGILPPEFSSWTDISSFHVEDSEIEGVLPDSYSAWTQVSEISLGNNRLAGTIPNSWSSFAGTLTLLDLHDNCKDAQNQLVAGDANKEKVSTGIIGSIPQWVATASKLQTLNLAGNKLTSTLPSALGSGLTALTAFSVALNHLSGHWQQFSSSALTALLANDNKFTGTMPSLLHNTNLRAIDVSRNSFGGSLPSGISALQSLTSAHFGGNAFSGSISSEYGHLKSLQELYLNFNLLTGALPDMSGNSNLVILQADNNKLNKPLPATMAAMQKLQYFAAWNNAIPGPLPTDLSSMSSLETLYLHKNQISGSLEPLLNNHKSPLKQINLSANKLSTIATDPSKLANLVSAQYLDLSSNQLRGPLTENIFALTNLTDLVLSNNKFSRSLPTNLGSLPRLKNLMASDCLFSGNLPFQLGEVSTLEKLDLSGNSLDGTVPFITNANIDCLALAEANPVKELKCITGLAKATNLKVLALHNNKFAGPILLPDETQGVFAAFKQLSVLNLAKNHLTSSIPRQVGLMTALTLFDVSYNSLMGVPPQELGADENIKTLRLNSNSFTGAFPALFCPVAGDFGLVNITGNHFSCYDGCWSSRQDDKQFSRDSSLAVCPRNPECPTTQSLPMRMMVALKELYLSTQGPAATEKITDPTTGQVTTYARSGWKWKTDVDVYGAQWDFSMDSQKTCFLKDPCKQKWQGIDCSCSSNPGPDKHTTDQDTGTENFYYDDKNDVHDPSGKCFVNKIALVDMGLDGPLPPVSMRELQGLTHLQLGVNTITGSLPDTLQELTDLVVLEVLDNEIQGSVPSWIGNLHSLKVLLVHINYISGSIPSEIGLLSSLEVFKGSHNLFAGSIPSEIASLSKLRVLDVAANSLSGPVPATSFNALKNLEYVDVSKNDLTGWFDFVTLGVNCRALRELHMDSNKLSGSLPKMAVTVNSAPVVLFPALTVLNLAKNTKISGPLDSTVFALPALTQIYLSGCAFSGNLPVFTGASPKLSIVDLSNNAGITGPIDASIGTLTSLTFLDVSGCKLTGSLSTQVKSMTALNFLSVAGNQLSGSIYGIDFSNLKNLENLWMNDNHFTGSLAPSLSALSKVQCLRFGNNKFQGTLSSFLGSLGTLTELDLSKNSFNGAIFSSVGNLKNLLLLDLSHSGVSGTIPDSVGSAWNLKTLNFAGNALTGAIPQSFSQLKALVRLDLSGNKLKGQIPALSDPHVTSNLQQLILNDNQLSGDISSVYPLTALQELNLAHNNLEGGVGQIDQLTSIVSLVLKNNKLNGELPSSLAAMSKAVVFDFSLNPSLGGNLPSDLDKLDNLKRLIVNNCNFQGGIPALPRGLKFLDLRFNKLSGSIDFNSLQQLRKLKSFRASNNELSGQLGSGVGKLVSLQELVLAKNSLQGPLPEAISLLTDLELLDLAHNLFSSTVPPSYASLTNLHVMNLDDNKINGRLEQMFCHSGNDDQRVDVSGPLMDISCIAPCWGASKNFVANPGVKVCGDAPPPSAVVHNFPTRPPHSSHPTSASTTLDGYLRFDEVDALKALYNALNGPNWRWRDNTDGKVGIHWDFSPMQDNNGAAQTPLLNDPCRVKWQGVVCTCKSFPAPPHDSSGNFYYDDDGSTTFHGSSSVCSVDKLQLVDYGLDGSLPNEVWALSSMTHAQLSNNFIAGTLPDALKYWTSVEKLHLSNNRLQGSLSGPIVQAWAEKMSQLWLDGNNLGGPLPSELGKLDKLEQLFLNNNNFQGGLPVALTGCTSLESLALHFNQLNGPLDPQGLLPKLHSLRNISVAFNHFTGPIPSNLNALTSLEALLVQNNELSGQLRDDIVSDESTLKKIDVSGNKLTGGIPASFSKLRRLELLSVGQNAGINGPLPDELAEMTALQILHVSQTAIEGTLPAGLGKLTNLRVLDISDTALHGASLPSELGSLTHLEIVSFARCKFADATIPQEWGQLANLKTLDLTKTGIGGSLPAELSGLKGLEALMAGSCRLGGPLPSDLFQHFSNLVSIQLSNNLFTGGLPAAVSDLTNLEEISLAGCKLSGALPSLTKLRKLKILNVGGNKKINGQIPVSITTLTALTLLDLGSCAFTGTIPPGLASLKLVDTVVLSQNLLQGTIPADIASLGFCSKLDLGYNSLSGTIPSDLSKMQKLRVFWASHNQLVSPLPNFSGLAGTLQELDLAYNKFVDPSIPALLFKLTGLQLLSLSSNGIEGSISPSLGQLTRLVQLDLSSMGLQGPLPAVVALLTNLVGLHIHNNKLTGQLPSDLFFDKNKRAGLSKVEVITLNNNAFRGQIPSMQGLDSLVSFAVNNNQFDNFPANLGSNTRLRELLMHNNLISTSIPSSIALLSSLEHLVLSSNNIPGTIPDLSALRGLQSLVLDHNRLTQNVPNSIGRCSALVELRLNSNLLGGGLPLYVLRNLPRLSILDLSGNQFNGPLSEDVAGMSALVELSLGANQLFSPIPAGLGQLTALKKLGLASNELVGTIPFALNALTNLVDLELQWNALTGPVPGLFCSNRNLPIFNVTSNPGLLCVRDCLLGNKNFLYDRRLKVCSNVAPPTLAPTYRAVKTSPPSSSAIISKNTVIYVSMYVSGASYDTVALNWGPYIASVKAAFVSVLGVPGLTVEAFFQPTIWNDPDGNTDDGPHADASAASLSLNLRRSRGLAATALVDVQLVIASNLAALTYSSAQTSIQAAVKSGALTAALKKAATSQGAAAFTSASVVKVNVRNGKAGPPSAGPPSPAPPTSPAKPAKPSKASTYSGLEQTQDETTVNIGEVVGVVLGLAATLLAIIAAVHFRHKVSACLSLLLLIAPSSYLFLPPTNPNPNPNPNLTLTSAVPPAGQGLELFVPRLGVSGRRFRPPHELSPELIAAAAWQAGLDSSVAARHDDGDDRPGFGESRQDQPQHVCHQSGLLVGQPNARLECTIRRIKPYLRESRGRGRGRGGLL